jgi:hypothetical protein
MIHFCSLGPWPTLNAKGVYMSDAEMGKIVPKITLRIYRKTLFKIRNGQSFCDATNSAVNEQIHAIKDEGLRSKIKSERGLILNVMASIFINRKHLDKVN